MDVVLKNLHKYNSNFYKGIEINEFSERNECLVKFFGRDVWFDSNVVGDRKIDILNEFSFEDKIRFIIKDYLDSTKIDFFTGIMKGNSIYGNVYVVANGTRYLEFNVKNIRLRAIVDDIYKKFCNDRYDFYYKNHGIKSFIIDTGDFSSYEVVINKLPYDNADTKKIMKMVLKTDNKGVIDSECQFIKEFIIDIFSKYNEQIMIEKVYGTDSLRKGILFRCRDIELYVPYYRNLLWIIDVVNKYNCELLKINSNVLKRQLKMEVF